MQGLWKDSLKNFKKDKQYLIKKEIFNKEFNQIKEDKVYEIFTEKNDLYKKINNKKFFFKNKFLEKYKYELFFDRFYFYGAYSIRMNPNRKKEKQMLKNFQNNNLNLLQHKYKNIILYG